MAVQSVVNSWQSHIPPISQTTEDGRDEDVAQLWIADKVISPLYHKQQNTHILLAYRKLQALFIKQKIVCDKRNPARENGISCFYMTLATAANMEGYES